MLAEILLASSLIFNSISMPEPTPRSNPSIMSWGYAIPHDVGDVVTVQWSYSHGSTTRKVCLTAEDPTGVKSISSNVSPNSSGKFSSANTEVTIKVKEGSNLVKLNAYCESCDEEGKHEITSTIDVKGVPPDTTLPVIESVSKSPSDWTNSSVLVDIYATDNKALHSTAYSFDNGLTWQSSSKKEFAENKALDINVRDARGNKAHRSVNIDNIDKLKPNKSSYEVR